ncbi:HAD family phosphatase [Carnobacteriaceae bacterium zg-ZUI240]|nr:HAD family phosphatase [Carnobacteriaceae bacterium zg-ZUI240]
MIRLVAVDMDATFLKDDKTYDVPLFKKVFSHLKERHVRFVVASGNGVSKLETSFDDEDKKHIIFAGDNGNHIQYRDDLIKVHGIERTTVIDLVQFLMTQEGYYPIINSTQTNYICPNNPEDALDAFYRYNVSVTELPAIEDLPLDAPLLNVAVYFRGTLEHTKDFAQKLVKRFPELNAVTSGEQWLDIFRVGGGKGSAITYLQQQFGIHPQECIAFGDSLNDVSMMKSVGLSVAMGNADPQLSEFCTYQIGTNNEQSVLKLLDELLERGEEALQQYKK